MKFIGGAGRNLWITDAFEVNLETSYNHHFKSTGTDYFQHSISVFYKLGTGKSIDRYE